FLEQSQQWLQDNWLKIQQQGLAQPAIQLPTQLQLFDLPTAIQVVYQDQRKKFILDCQQFYLYIDHENAQQNLKAFILQYAKQKLPDFLQQVSEQTGMTYQSCQIRYAKSRWGSCSAQHKIMLNAALVLMPKNVARYVIIHELAHTRYFNHSPSFWAEVGKYDNDYHVYREKLKKLQIQLAWLHG
ncbi:MAG: SprT family zinc-dependent metalloprotease, partial [Acinetobacter sp.]